MRCVIGARPSAPVFKQQPQLACGLHALFAFFSAQMPGLVLRVDVDFYAADALARKVFQHTFLPGQKWLRKTEQRYKWKLRV